MSWMSICCSDEPWSDHRASLCTSSLIARTCPLSRLAELLHSRGCIDGQLCAGRGHSQAQIVAAWEAETPLSVCLSSVSGSTFLQRLYRICCTSKDWDKLEQHWSCLLRLAEDNGSFHATTRNNAGQTLLHTLCSRMTYQVRLTASRLFADGLIVFDDREFRDCTIMVNRSKHLAG